MFVVSSSWLCFLGGLGVYEVLEGARHVVLSLFVVICLLFKLRMPCLSSYILCAGFRWASSFGFEIESRGLAAIFV